MARLQALLLLALFAVSKGAHGAARMSIHTYTHSHHDVIEPHEAASVIAVRRDTTFEQFITELAEVMESHHLKKRALDWLFDEEAVLARPHPHCNGLWMEFGVFSGNSINKAAQYRKKYCETEEKVYGFDTFSGLPEDWDNTLGEGGGKFVKGTFSLGGNLPDVEPNVELVKGLFSESLPPFLAERYAVPHPDVTYLHIDCDLYQGAIDVLTLLNRHLAPGCVLLFDELFNYGGYKENEVKALYEWLKASQRKVQVIGMLGPLDGRTTAVDLNTGEDLGWVHQSAAFKVL